MSTPDVNPPELIDGQKNRAAVAARARGIRESVVGASRLTPTEQDRISGNLWGILAEAERSGVRKAAILERAGLGGPGSSTKYLGRYARNPDPKARPIKGEPLTKTASRYLRIAEAAGEMVGSDRDLFVAALFNGTRFASAGNAVASEDVYTELSGLLRTVCAGIARRHDLLHVFRLCDERGLCRLSGALRHNRDDRWGGVWSGFADGAAVKGLLDDEGHWIIPYPNFLVGWGQLTKGILFSTSGPDASEDDKGHLDSGEMLLEVRLALLPVGPGGDVEPVFLTCFWTVLDFVTHPSAMLGTGTRQVSFRGTPRSTMAYGLQWELLEGDTWEDVAPRFAGIEPALSYWDRFRSDDLVRVDLVSPESCRRLLSLQSAEGPETGRRASTVVDDLDPALDDMSEAGRDAYWDALVELDPDDRDSAKWRSEPGTLAEVLEYSLLFTSSQGPRQPLDMVLDAACGRMSTEVTALVADADAVREGEKARLLARWGSPDDSPTS